MTEENKAIARRVYEIISAGDFDRAQEIVDASAPDNELLAGGPSAKLIDTFKDTFSQRPVRVSLTSPSPSRT